MSGVGELGSEVKNSSEKKDKLFGNKPDLRSGFVYEVVGNATMPTVLFWTP